MSASRGYTAGGRSLAGACDYGWEARPSCGTQYAGPGSCVASPDTGAGGDYACAPRNAAYNQYYPAGGSGGTPSTHSAWSALGSAGGRSFADDFSLTKPEDGLWARVPAVALPSYANSWADSRHVPNASVPTTS